MPWLQVATSHLKGEVYEPGAQRITIGRRTDNLVCIPDSTVSSYHAVLTREGDGYCVEDLGSTNGTYVNGARVVRAPLGAAAKVQFGAIEFLYLDRGPIPVVTPVTVAEPAAPVAGSAAPLPAVAAAPAEAASGRSPFGQHDRSPLPIGSMLKKKQAGPGQTVSTGQGGNDSRNARP